MRFKFTVFLLALNIIVFGLILFLSKRSEKSDSAMGGLSGQLGREVIESDRIELRGQGLSVPRILIRSGSSWSISEPMQWSANYFAVNRILNQLQFLEEEASFSVKEIEKTGQTLADYGLEDPIIQLTIAEGDEALHLKIGTLTEIGNNVYLLGPNGEDIFVVGRQVIDGLLVDLGDLRTREIFDIPVFEIEALSLQINDSATDGKVRLARTNTGWNFESPLTAEADPTLVSNTINTLTAAKVLRFIEQEANDPILQGLENPFMRVTLQGNKRRQTLLIGNKDSVARGEPAYYAKLENNPTVFTVEAKAFDDLLKAQEALRERNFMTFNRDALTEIKITEGERQIRLQKLENGSNWQVIESTADTDIQPRRTDPEIMEALIQNLLTLRASGFAVDAPNAEDLEEKGFNQPRRSVILTFKDGKTNTLLLAHPSSENNKLYARTSSAEYIYEVERRPTLMMMPLNAQHYRNRNLDTLPEAAAINSLQLTNLLTGEKVFEYQRKTENTDWLTTLADLPEKEQAAALVLLDGIRNFRVKAYLKDAYTESYRPDSDTTIPWAYQLNADISLPGDETARKDTRSYVFSKRLSGTVQIGASILHNTVFEIPQEMIDALYEYTESMPQPPEMKNEPVPEPERIAPVPEPMPTEASE